MTTAEMVAEVHMILARLGSDPESLDEWETIAASASAVAAEAKRRRDLRRSVRLKNLGL